MRVSLDVARQFWAHPSQHEAGLTEAALPDWAVYFARSGVCLAFHPCPVPGGWFVHIGAHPSAWGRTTEPALKLLAEFAGEFAPQSVIAWIPDGRRAAIALARRAGFCLIGSAAGAVMLEWRP